MQANKPNNIAEDIYDVIVIGVGSMGSSTLYQLAKRGLKVLGLEQFNIAHDKGSHSGQTRVIRKAYFEHPNYVPLLKRAYELWDEIEQESGEQLVHKVGLVSLGKEEHPAIQGTRESSRLYDVPLKEMDSSSFPQFNTPSDFCCLFEEEAGFVLPEKSVQVYSKQALMHGAEIREQEQVLSWELKGGLVEMTTNKGKYKTRKLVGTAGAFTSQLMPGLKNHLKVTRQLVAWVKPKSEAAVHLGELPCWFLGGEESEGMFYGFPVLDLKKFSGEYGLKIGHHMPGEEAQPQHIHDFDSAGEEQKIKNFMDRYMPDIFESIVSVKSCLYTYSDDGDFIIDYLPDTNNKILFAAGFSGHGFKFAPVIGEILADLVEDEKTDQPIEFLSLERFDG